LPQTFVGMAGVKKHRQSCPQVVWKDVTFSNWIY